MTVNKLPKVHRLCSKTAIDRLFARTAPVGGGAALAYPLRAVWAPAELPDEELTRRPPLKFLISIPKKRLRHAVDRVLMRRRVREAYRLARVSRIDENPSAAVRYDVAFIYVADKTEDYARVNAAVRRLLKKIYPPAT